MSPAGQYKGDGVTAGVKAALEGGARPYVHWLCKVCIAAALLLDFHFSAHVNRLVIHTVNMRCVSRAQLEDQ